MAGIGIANGWNPVGWGLLIGAAVVGLGTLIGAEIKAATDNDVTDRENEALELLKREYRASGKDEKFFDENNMRDVLGRSGFGDMADSLVENKKQTEELIKSMAENTEASYKNTNAILAQTYGDEVSPFLTKEYDER
jgi:hypothetical protein